MAVIPRVWTVAGFTAWIVISIIWLFVGATIVILLPIYESRAALGCVRMRLSCRLTPAQPDRWRHRQGCVRSTAREDCLEQHGVIRLSVRGLSVGSGAACDGVRWHCFGGLGRSRAFVSAARQWTLTLRVSARSLRLPAEHQHEVAQRIGYKSLAARPRRRPRSRAVDHPLHSGRCETHIASDRDRRTLHCDRRMHSAARGPRQSGRREDDLEDADVAALDAGEHAEADRGRVALGIGDDVRAADRSGVRQVELVLRRQ